MIHSRGALLHAVGSLLDFVEELEARRGKSLEILDFGGSLATPAVHHLGALDLRLNRTFQRDLPEPQPQHCLSIEEYVTTIRSTVEQRYRLRNRPLPRIFLEPGRSFDREARAGLAARFPAAMDEVVREVAARRVQWLVRSGWFIPETTWRFWNHVAGGWPM